MSATDKKAKPLSATMAAGLAAAVEHGGILERLQGGFWTYPGATRRAHDGVPDWYVGATTVQALVDRGRMTYTDWKEGRGYKFPIRATATPEVT